MPYVNANAKAGLDRRRTIAWLRQTHKLSTADIAQTTGLTVRTVRRHLSRAGLTRVPAEPLSDLEHERALTLLQDGAPYEEVGRTLGRSPETIKKHLPGFQWSPQQISHHALMIRDFHRRRPSETAATR